MLQIYLILKKKMSPLTKELLNYTKMQEIVTFCIFGKRILQKLTRNKNYQKVRDHCHYTGKCKGAAHSIFNWKFNVSNDGHIK